VAAKHHSLHDSSRALLDAVDRGDELGAARLLRKERVDTLYVGIRGVEVLHVAARAELVSRLAEWGARVNPKTDAKQSGEAYGAPHVSQGGNTPLHFSSFSGHADVARVLLENRCEVVIKNENNDTPLDVAKSALMPKVAPRLRLQ